MAGFNQAFYCGTFRPDCRPFRTGIFTKKESRIRYTTQYIDSIIDIKMRPLCSCIKTGVILEIEERIALPNRLSPL